MVSTLRVAYEGGEGEVDRSVVEDQDDSVVGNGDSTTSIRQGESFGAVVLGGGHGWFSALGSASTELARSSSCELSEAGEMSGFGGTIVSGIGTVGGDGEAGSDVLGASWSGIPSLSRAPRCWVTTSRWGKMRSRTAESRSLSFLPENRASPSFSRSFLFWKVHLGAWRARQLILHEPGDLFPGERLGYLGYFFVRGLGWGGHVVISFG